MRFIVFSTTLLTLTFANAQFLLPRPMSHISTGLPSQIAWTTNSIAGPVSLYLVPAEAPDIGASIFTIGTQIPNRGMYQWVPSQTLFTAASSFSILMVDSNSLMAVSGTFLIDGLQSSPPNSGLRRRAGVHVANFRYRKGESSSDSPRESGYKTNSSGFSNSGKETENNKSNSTEMKTIKSEKGKTSKLAALDTDLSACSPSITRTKYVYMGAASVPNNNEKSSGRSKLTANFASLKFCLDEDSKGRNGSCSSLASGFEEGSVSRGTNVVKSPAYDSDANKHSYGAKGGSDENHGSGSQSASHDSNSKGNHGSKSPSSGDGSKESNDSSGHESGSKESKEHGSGTDSGHKSGHESNSKHEDASTRTDCTLITTTTIIFVSSSEKTHTHDTKTSESAPAPAPATAPAPAPATEKTSWLSTAPSPSESLTSITLASSTTLITTTSLKPSITSPLDLSTAAATSAPQDSQTPPLSPLPPQSSNAPQTTSAPSVENTPSTSSTPDTSPPTQRIPPVIVTTLSSTPSSTRSAYGNLTIHNTKSGTAVPVFTGGAHSNRGMGRGGVSGVGMLALVLGVVGWLGL